jgi:SAM-dependent methyltransferase
MLESGAHQPRCLNGFDPDERAWRDCRPPSRRTARLASCRRRTGQQMSSMSSPQTNGCQPVPGPVSRVLDRLACPRCRSPLAWEPGGLTCRACVARYPLVGNVLDLRLPTAQASAETAWTAHWSPDNQRSMAQAFFSLYRKAVFARSVSYFIDRYFPPAGIFVEAGSGTAETSMRIDKRKGARTLVATDIVLPVLSQCHPNMDLCICADIFQLPFRADSLDGVWNVGVMEHFTRDEIDRSLRELHRVLKDDGRILLLWPGTDSIPQKILRLIERVINVRNTKERFRFHPEEISQLRSVREGNEILARNGFRAVGADFGPRTLMAFKTLVGAKRADASFGKADQLLVGAGGGVTCRC